MTATLLDGKKVAEEIKEQLKESIKKLTKKPGLAVILVGEDPASHIYVNKKEKACEEVGIQFEKYLIEKGTTEEVETIIKKLNENENIHGILVQLPLPNHLDTEQILKTIKQEKDVDGITPSMWGKLIAKEETFAPCTPKGIITLLETNNIVIEKKQVVIINRSIIGKALAIMMLNRNATVTVCHSQTEDIENKTKEADILITAAGKPNLITENMVKEGAVIIDVGISREEGKIKGDVDFEKVKEKVSYISPVPGGVGPMTVITLLQNTYEAAK